MRAFIRNNVLSLTFCAGVFMATSAFGANNLLFNSSFEIGGKGYSSNKATLVKNGKYKYTGKAGSIDESVAKHGSVSMKITKGRNDCVRFTSHECELAGGQKYTFSFWMKGNKKGNGIRIMALSVENGGQWALHSQDVHTETDWKFYKFTFNTKPDHKYYHLRIDLPEGDSVTVWLDALKLEKGNDTPYSPAAAVEAAVYSDKRIYSAGNKMVNGTVKVISYDRDFNKKTNLLLKDAYRNKAVADQSFEANLKAGIALTKKFSFKAEKFGSFIVSSDINKPEDTFKSAGHFLYLRTPRKKCGDNFETGFNTNVSSVEVMDWFSDKLVFTDQYGSPGAKAGDFYWTGGKLVRTHDDLSSFLWSCIEHEKGKYDWSLPDMAVQEAEANHIEILAMLGNGGFLMGGQKLRRPPKWLIKKDQLKGYGTKTLTRPEYKVILPPLEDWRRFVGAIARRYKGRIKYYEIMNEPNLYLTAKIYVKYLKAAYEEIKKADRNTIVAGICSTGDFNSDLGQFLKECFDHGAQNYLDAVSFHPYAAAMSTSAYPAHIMIRDIKSMLKKRGIKKPLWDSEVYYLLAKNTGNHSTENNFDAAALARRCLIDMGEGLNVSTPLKFNQLYNNVLVPHLESGFYFSTEKVAGPRFAICNALMHFTAGAKTGGSLKLPAGVMGYAFENHGKYYAAVWSPEQKIKLTAELPENTVVYDIMGNSLFFSNSQNKTITLDLFNRPFYFESVNEEELRKAIETAQISSSKVSPGGMRLTKNNAGQTCLVVTLKNSLPKTVDGIIRIRSKNIKQLPRKVTYGPVRPWQELTVEIPVKIKSGASGDEELTIMISGAGKIFTFKQKIPVIKFTETGSSQQKINRVCKGTINGKSDLAASFSVKQKDGNLNIIVNVVDDIKGKPSRHPWDCDSIELFIDPQPSKNIFRHPGKYNDDTSQLFICPYLSGDKRIQVVKGTLLRSSDIKCTVKPLGHGYSAMISIPLNKVAKSDGSIGFDIGINDSDGTVRKSQIIWSGNAENYKNRSGFGCIYIAK